MVSLLGFAKPIVKIGSIVTTLKVGRSRLIRLHSFSQSRRT